MVKVMGGWADGTLALRLDGGMALLLKDCACSSVVDPAVILALPGLEEFDGVTPDERQAVTRQLREARTVPFPQFLAIQKAALLLEGTSEGASKAWKTRKRIGGFAGVRPVGVMKPTGTGFGIKPTGTGFGVKPTATAKAKPHVIKSIHDDDEKSEPFVAEKSEPFVAEKTEPFKSETDKLKDKVRDEPDDGGWEGEPTRADDDDDESELAKMRAHLDKGQGASIRFTKRFDELDAKVAAAKKPAEASDVVKAKMVAAKKPDVVKGAPTYRAPKSSPLVKPKKKATTPIAKVGQAIKRFFSEDHIGDPNVQVFYSKIKHLRR